MRYRCWLGLECPYRKGFSKGVKSGKGRTSDSLNRKKKTRDFRHNDKVRTRWPQGGGARTFWVKQNNRDARREVNAQIKKAMLDGNWDSIKNWQDPVDTWLWD